MIDQNFDRDYRAARAELNAGIDTAVASVTRFLGESLAALHRIEWDAPWADRRTAHRHH